MGATNVNRPVRPCRPDEDPVDWMHATGQMTDRVYQLMRGTTAEVAAARDLRAAQVAAAVGPIESLTPEQQYALMFDESDRVKAEAAANPRGRVLGMPEGYRW